MGVSEWQSCSFEFQLFKIKKVFFICSFAWHLLDVGIVEYCNKTFFFQFEYTLLLVIWSFVDWRVLIAGRYYFFCCVSWIMAIIVPLSSLDGFSCSHNMIISFSTSYSSHLKKNGKCCSLSSLELPVKPFFKGDGRWVHL